MPNLRWLDVAPFFDPELNGALPDVQVPGTSVADWQAVFDLVRSSGWTWEYAEDERVVPLRRAAEVFARPAGAEAFVARVLRVRPVSDLLVLFRPMSATEIDFDVDLRELQGQHRLDLLCGFLTAIGRHLSKPVLLFPEGAAGCDPVFGYDPGADKVVLMADPMAGRS